jgi:general L-amino acid transport system permease protein
MSGIGVVLATIVGFTVGVARLSPNWLISRMATVYIETLRNIPLLLQIFFWYFAVLRAVPGPRQSINIGDAFFINNRGLYSPSPIFGDGFGLVVICFAAAIVGIIVLSRWAHKRQQATGEQFPVFLTSLGLFFGLPVLGLIVASLAYGGIPLTLDYPALKGFNFKGGMVMIPEFVALLLALSAYTAAFIAEIVRAGILAVSHGQTEAARSLGLRNTPTLRLVIIPQAMRVIIPPLTSQYLNLTKNSSLAAAIAYPELVSIFAGTVLNQTGQAVEVIGITMAIYLGLSLSISALMNWYNKKMALVER